MVIGRAVWWYFFVAALAAMVGGLVGFGLHVTPEPLTAPLDLF
jgi:hypothetical protein